MRGRSNQWGVDMNTTSIFVELVVIGLHTTIWTGLIILTFTGYQNLDLEKVFTLNLALPILAITYILGILIDRASDIALAAQDDRLRSKYDLRELPGFLSMRFYILSKSSEVYAQLEYTRSRLRIARASVLNFAFTTLAAAPFVWFQLGKTLAAEYRAMVCLVVVIIGALLTWISYRSWTGLSHTYTINTIRAYQVLRDEADKSASQVPKAEVV
jgi:hypothetical protein